MSDTQAPEPPGFYFAVGYAERIARVAVEWASLESMINETIWELAMTPHALGACITSQLGSLHTRLSALLSLMKVRECSDVLISKVNKFAERSREPQELRNRIIHDQWVNSIDDTRIMGRVEIVAPRRLSMEIKTIPLAKLDEDLIKIKQITEMFSSIRSDIIGSLPSLPEKSKSELRPIYSIPLDQ
jgi:hypothetical protein